MDASTMTPFDPVGHDLAGHLVMASTWLAVGIMIGTFHFLMLRQTMRLNAANRPLALPLIIHLARFAVIATALAVIARFFGAVPLVVATLGIVAARTAVLRFGVPL
jgi:hypothetical protein